MEKFKKTPEQKIEKLVKLSREDVIKRLEKKENLENLNLTNLDLSGLDFEGKSFCGSDIRGLTLYNEEQSEGTNIKNADFTDAIIADMGPEVLFAKINAEGATFGFTEKLSARKNRLQKSGQTPEAADTGGLHNFNGSAGNFKKTKWHNADFGGADYPAHFLDADLTEAQIKGCDLNNIDFSETKIEKIKIIDPVSLNGLIINQDQIHTLIESIHFTDPNDQAEFLNDLKENGAQKVLKDSFGINIVNKE